MSELAIAACENVREMAHGRSSTCNGVRDWNRAIVMAPTLRLHETFRDAKKAGDASTAFRVSCTHTHTARPVVANNT